MDNPLEQSQEGGADSTNVQAGKIVIVHQHGLGYGAVKEIVLDVFRDNFETLSKVAMETARARAEKITEDFLTRLQKENSEGLKKAETPEFQLSLLTVQREYARSGDAELGSLLVDLLIDLSKQEQRSIQEIVLHECLTVAPKLTADQLAALGVVFYFRYTRSPHGFALEIVKQLLERSVIPFADLLSKKETPYRHLEFLGGGTIGLGEVILENVLQVHYPAAFTDGFTEAELSAALPGVDHYGIIFPSSQNPENVQFNTPDFEALNHLFKDKETAEKAKALWTSKLWSPAIIKAKLIELLPPMDKVFDVWNNSSMKHLQLTTVGMAIGHAYLKSKTELRAELSTWVN
jgi:hypothetical protein